jgi:hypothetical protein
LSEKKKGTPNLAGCPLPVGLLHETVRIFVSHDPPAGARTKAVMMLMMNKNMIMRKAVQQMMAVLPYQHRYQRSESAENENQQ